MGRSCTSCHRRCNIKIQLLQKYRRDTATLVSMKKSGNVEVLTSELRASETVGSHSYHLLAGKFPGVTDRIIRFPQCADDRGGIQPNFVLNRHKYLFDVFGHLLDWPAQSAKQ